MDFDFDGRRTFTFNESNFEMQYCFQVTIEDDGFLEDTETFSLIVSADEESGAHVSMKNARHRVGIYDDDSMLNCRVAFTHNCY